MTDWTNEAACLGIDPAVFFPVATHLAASMPAKRICRTCPVRVDCLRHAMRHETSLDGVDRGVWAGLTTRERTALKKLRAAS